jgi:hypothetical protein
MTAALLQQIIESGMVWSHFGSLNRSDDDVCGVDRLVSSLGAGFQPIVVVGRHKDELSAPVPGDFDRLALRLMLEFAELALKFESADCGHDTNLPVSVFVLYV